MWQQFTKKQLIYKQILEDQEECKDLKFYQGFFYWLPEGETHWKRVELPVYVQKKYGEAVIGNDAKWLAMMLTDADSPIAVKNKLDRFAIRTKNGFDIRLVGEQLVVLEGMSDFTPYNIPVDYDPSVKGPTVDKFMAGVVSPNSCVENLYEILGEPLIREGKHSSKAHLIWGGQGTGKSTFLELFYPLYGECATNVPFKNIQQGKRCHALTYSLVNVDDDIDEKQYGDVKTIKQIVTRNKFSVDNLYSNKALEITPRFCNIFSCNDLPEFSSKGREISIRFRVESFPNTFRGTDKDDTDMPEKLRRELPYLLNRCIEGANRLLARGMKFQDTADSEEFATEVKHQDTVVSFLEDYANNIEGLPMRQVYDLYAEVTDKDVRWHETYRKFNKRMRELGYEKGSKRDDNGNVYHPWVKIINEKGE